MNTTRNCGCKGYRSCYLCENEFDIPRLDLAKQLNEEFGRKSSIFCMQCNHIVSTNSWNVDLLVPCDKSGMHNDSISKPFPGVQVVKDFISETEEIKLVDDLDLLNWDTSQSGRRKQNFGPRANFKKRKAKAGKSFRGFPMCTKFVQDRFNLVDSLEDFKTIEQCSIEYRPETGASIDPHIDDCWIWGERIVQLNMLSDSTLTCTPFKKNTGKYNLADVGTYPRVLDPNGKILYNPFKYPCKPFEDVEAYTFCADDELFNETVRIPLPRRSLLVFYGQPRYQWEHCILREDITSRRVIIAYREFTPTYLPGGKDQLVGEEIMRIASQFWE